MAQIRFTTMKGFEEFPHIEVLIKNHYKGGVEEWFDWFGPGIHIDDYELNQYTRAYLTKDYKYVRYVLSARTDEMSDVMIACFGTDVILTDTLGKIKTKALKMLEYMNYTRPYYEKYEIVR